MMEIRQLRGGVRARGLAGGSVVKAFDKCYNILYTVVCYSKSHYNNITYDMLHSTRQKTYALREAMPLCFVETCTQR